MTTATVLDRVMYTEVEAARLLRVPKSTLHYWLEGKAHFKPVIRIEPTGDRSSVTWAEFVEAGLLRQYRELNVPMAELRFFIERLRVEFGVPYPLATMRPLVYGMDLVAQLQDEANLPPDFFLVGRARDQLALLPVAEKFVRRVTWRDGVAAEWRPHDDEGSPVRVSPEVRSGRPSVGGISTEALWELAEYDELTVPEIAETYALAAEDVHWALSYETSFRAAG